MFHTGDTHKRQRKMLNPLFSTKHMKVMIPLFYKVLHKVCNAITKQVMDQPQELDMLSWISRTALELIGVAGLGYSFESFDEKTSPSAYTRAVKEFMCVNLFYFLIFIA
jgi:cytochrome P450